MKSVATMRGNFDDNEDLKHLHDYDWLCEAITMVSCLNCLHCLDKTYSRVFLTALKC